MFRLMWLETYCFCSIGIRISYFESSVNENKIIYKENVYADISADKTIQDTEKYNLNSLLLMLGMVFWLSKKKSYFP